MYKICSDDVISIEQFFCSPKILVFNTTVSFSFNVLKGIAISAEEIYHHSENK